MAGLKPRLLIEGQRRPLGLGRAHHGGAINLGQAIHVGNGNTHLLHGFNHRGRGRCRRGHHAHFLVKGLTLVIGGAGDHRHNNGRPTQVGHTVLGKGCVNALGRRAAHKHMGTREQRNGPGEAPAVAVKQRQRPKINRVMGHFPGHHIVHRVGPGAAVGIDHAFGVTGGAGGVVQRQGVPLVIGQGIGKIF